LQINIQLIKKAPKSNILVSYSSKQEKLIPNRMNMIFAKNIKILGWRWKPFSPTLQNWTKERIEKYLGTNIK
jgi:hypothetical protein